MSNYTDMLQNLEQLNLDKIRSMIPEYLESVKSEPPHIVDVLLTLTNEEIKHKTQQASEALIRTAAFPFKKTLDDFDFDFQPSINKDEIYDLATLRFIEDKSNILFVGNSGVGKTHLAVALGIKATEHRYSVYFITCHALIMKLNKAQKENRLDKLLRHMCQYRILIIDEIGYLPVDKEGSNLFFQLINKRYGNKTTIITTNMPFSKWSDVFYDTRDKFLLSLLYETGIRIGEALSLWIEDVDISNKILDIKDRGNLENNAEIKTVFSPRKIDISQNIIDMFMEYINIYHNENVLTNHIFIKIAGKRKYYAMDYIDVVNVFRALQNKTQIYVTAHMFRHTSLTALRMAGWKPEFLRIRAGHKNIYTTLNTYVHPSETEIAEAFNNTKETISLKEVVD